MPKTIEAASVLAIVHGARVDREGSWKLTLEVQPSEGVKVAALALQTEAVFRVTFTPAPQETPGA